MKNNVRGFTLIEVMIGLVVIGVLAFVGLPEFTIMMANIKIRTASEAILNGMQTARGEAVQRNGTVQFVLGNQSAYQVIFVDSTGVPTVIRSRSENEGSSTANVVVTPGGATQVTFNSFGRVAANGDGSASIQRVDVNSTTSVDASTRHMTVLVSNSVRMCDPQLTVTVATDPRSCLP
jgi:type IV fimbrial biogenesis protein FimT